MVKEKEGLTSKLMYSSEQLLKDGNNYDFRVNNNYGEDTNDYEDDNIVSDYNDLSDNEV